MFYDEGCVLLLKVLFHPSKKMMNKLDIEVNEMK